jgi:uncharacterized protein involved in outer membrane biogenesis
MKKALKIIGIIVGVLVVLLLVAWLMIDRIAKAGIEKGGTYALGVNTTCDSVGLSLLKGELGVSGLTVANPEGFETPHFIKTGRVEVGVDTGTLLSNTIVVNRFELKGLDLNFEHGKGTTNVSAILDNLKSPEAGKKAETPKEEGGRKVKINKVLLHDIVAHVQMLPLGGKASTLDIKIDELVLENVDSDGSGISVADLIRRLVPAVLAAIFERGKGVITDADFGKLGDQIGEATQSLGAGAAHLTKQATENMGKAAKDAEESLKKGGDAIKKGVEGLFGGRK